MYILRHVFGLYERPFARRMPRRAAFGVGWWRIFLEYLRRHQRAQWCHDAKTFPLQPRLQCWTRRPDKRKNIYATCVNTINIEERGKGKIESTFTNPARCATPAIYSTNGNIYIYIYTHTLYIYIYTHTLSLSPGSLNIESKSMRELVYSNLPPRS